MSNQDATGALERYTQQAVEHIAYLTQEIGGRGSCTQQEHEAADYIADQLSRIGGKDVQRQPFLGAPSAYARYALTFSTGLAATAIALAWRTPATAVVAAALHGVAAAGMLAESDFIPNWTHRIIPGRPSQNVLAILPARQQPKKHVILTAHMDSHRTPVFNTNRFWQRVFNVGFRALFASLILGALLHVLIVFADSALLRVLSLIPAILLAAGILLFLQADLTPYSPGAYDNASGVASVLALGERLSKHPLRETQVTLALLGCEENGSWGSYALLKEYAGHWQASVMINLDQMALGTLYVRIREGFLIRRHPKPEMLRLVHRVAESFPELGVFERPSQAFSDATPAYKAGISAISLGTTPLDEQHEIHRHQMSDTIEHVEFQALQSTQQYVWALLQAIDSATESPAYV